jgi:Ca-activated chloride channel family protein
VHGLGPEDFEVVEDGVRQKVAVAASEEIPFNLVLLLDFSTSALRSRSVLEQAARGFLEIARPQDRVAVYALADSLFQVISPLSAGRGPLIEKIVSMPRQGGASPVYDTLVLAYAQEDLIASGERTAIVFITDGIDNSLHDPAGGSKTDYQALLRLASGVPVLIYPVVLPPPVARRPFAASQAVIDAAPEARRRLQELADRTGGRLFATDSTFSMKPVYPLVAQELEKVYAVAYYPRNQEHDGRWRRVEVRVRRPGVTFRTREGYYAR